MYYYNITNTVVSDGSALILVEFSTYLYNIIITVYISASKLMAGVVKKLIVHNGIYEAFDLGMTIIKIWNRIF